VNAARDRKRADRRVPRIPAQVVTAEQLGISKEVQQLCYLTKGLVLVTGPTGSGSPPRCCALVDLINRTRTDHIITIEDPIEFVHENKKCVSRSGSGVHTDTSSGRCDRPAGGPGHRAGRRDAAPGDHRHRDRDRERRGTPRFGTLHTTTAASTVDRIHRPVPGDRQSQIRVNAPPSR